MRGREALIEKGNGLSAKGRSPNAFSLAFAAGPWKSRKLRDVSC